jgi:desulfoferrodoxin (superoxide reductase-like protein)
MSSNISRRFIVRAIPTVAIASAVLGLGRVLSGCTESQPNLTGGTTPKNKPTDDDEYVPPNDNPPVEVGGEKPPVVPNQTWEARAKQLEDEQARVYGPVFSKEAPGIFAGKERSHVPEVTFATEGELKKVTAVVLHVMGANGLDAGVYDGGDAEAGRDGEAGIADGGDAGDASDAGDAGDAARDATVDAAPPPVHYITTIYLRATVDGKDTVVGLWEFPSNAPAPPSVKFTLPKGVTSVVAYEWCTLHGLWKSDAIAV